MTRVSINPGRVDWSGENPGIYLKNSASDEHYGVLSLFFRVVMSPYGRGHAAIVLAAPDAARGWPDETNFILTDNQQMMRWIVDGRAVPEHSRNSTSSSSILFAIASRVFSPASVTFSLASSGSVQPTTESAMEAPRKQRHK